MNAGKNSIKAPTLPPCRNAHLEPKNQIHRSCNRHPSSHLRPSRPSAVKKSKHNPSLGELRALAVKNPTT
jgi:hypothetical protein